MRIQTAFADKGLHFAGDDGTIVYGGAQVDYRYTLGPTDVLGGLLEVIVRHQPFLHSFSGFCDQLKASIEAIK